MITKPHLFRRYHQVNIPSLPLSNEGGFLIINIDSTEPLAERVVFVIQKAAAKKRCGFCVFYSFDEAIAIAIETVIA